MVPRSTEGGTEATWIVGDYIDVVLHVFTPEAREFYRLEDLWDDVPHETLEAATAVTRRPYGGTRLRVRATLSRLPGPIAQLGERLAGSQKVVGSSPAGST